MKQPSTLTRALITSTLVLLAIVGVGLKAWDYWKNPWTRNGRVMAQVVQVTPRVTGTVVELPIIDNQFVKRGDLLFRVDPRTYESTLAGAQGLLSETVDEIEALAAQVKATRASVEEYESGVKWTVQKVTAKEAQLTDAQAQFKRYSELVKTGAASREQADRAQADVIDAQASLDAAIAELARAEAARLQAEANLSRDIANLGAEGDANARLRTAKARVHSAALRLEFTEVRAKVNGYITHLDLRIGDQAVETKPALALVDVDSYWVYGYFKEHYVGKMQIGDRALVTLMGYRHTPIEGRVAGRGWGVFQSDGATSQQLLPHISAVYTWARLPQRIPVRIEFDEIPEGIDLVVGATATVQVFTGTADEAAEEMASATSQ